MKKIMFSVTKRETFSGLVFPRSIFVNNFAQLPMLILMEKFDVAQLE